MSKAQQQFLDSVDTAILKALCERWLDADKRLKAARDEVARIESLLLTAQIELHRCELDRNSAAREICRIISGRVNL